MYYIISIGANSEILRSSRVIFTDIASEILENQFITSRELENETSVNKERINLLQVLSLD